MIYCDYDYDNYITDKYYDRLTKLSPEAWSAEKFRLQLQELPIHLLAGDRFVGRFGFTKKINTDGLRTVRYTETAKEAAALAFPETIGSTTAFDRAHTLADYDFILKNGLIWYELKVDAELKKDPENEYLLAMKVELDAVKDFIKRISGYLDNKLIIAPAGEKKRLEAMQDLIERVPFNPAKTFKEALQSIWIIHFLLPMAEDAWASISLGRFDKYMYPYYKDALASGMTREEIKEELKYFYSLLNSYSDGACVLNVGPEYNELSLLLIECQRDFNLPGPILAARIDENTTDATFEKLIDPALFAMGQPTFYSESGCKAALRARGVAENEIESFANNSCMGISIPAKEINNMWACVFSVSSALDMALNSGSPLAGAIDVPDFKNIDELISAFEAQLKINFAGCVKAYETRVNIHGTHFPDPFWTMLLDGCIEKKCDRAFSVKYHNATVECMGTVNVADGIYAINELVFKRKKYTLTQLVQAVKCNFDGYDEIKTEMLRCNKYGANTDADDMAVRISDIVINCVESFNHGNIHYLPSLHTLDANVGYGHRWGAGFDGRQAGKPFAKNAGPCDDVRTSDPTSLIMSACKLPQAKFHGGQPIDVMFNPKYVAEKKMQIASLIRVYLQNGGIQFQVNAVSSAMLRDALDNPEKYKTLIVRVGGYSDYFNKLGRGTKLDFIKRFEIEEGKNG